MNRLDKLKRLKDEVGRLFNEGLDEIAVIDRLRTVEQFADISYEQVQAFYSKLQEESNAEAESKRQIEEKDRQIAEHEEQIAEYQELIEEHERLLAREQQMKIELGFMDKYEQNSNMFLICDESHVNRTDIKCFWQKRFLMTVKDRNIASDVHTIKIQDLYQKATKSFTIQKVDCLYGIHALKFPFVLLDESNSSNSINYFRLTKFDFESDSLQTIQLFKFNGACHVLISASDVSKFLLEKRNAVNECKLVGGQIQIGKRLALESGLNIYRGSYFDGQLCVLQFESSWDNPFENLQLTQVKMLVYNLERNEHSTYDIDSTPEDFDCLNPNYRNYFAWIRDTVFITIQFSLTKNYGVIFTNPQVRNWNKVEFASDLPVVRIQSFVYGTLMICSEEESKKKIYKLQMRKPDFLRNMAWNAMVKLLKEAKVNNPYEEARQYLPLNSEIQPFVFTED